MKWTMWSLLLTVSFPHSHPFFFFTGLEERSNGGSPILRPLLPAMSPPDSVVSYEDDFVSSQGSGTLTDKKNGLEPR